MVSGLLARPHALHRAMEFYVQKDSQQYGPLTSTALQEHLQAGTFALTDLAWDQKSTNWLPLEDVLRLQGERQSKSLSRGLAFLQCISGPDLGKRVQLIENQPVIIGTSPDSNVLSDDPDTLPHHVQVTVSQRKVNAEALEGAGLYLDGLAFTSGTIGSKQQLRVGRSLWQVEVPRDLKAGAGAMIGNMADRISSAAGLEQLQDFRAKNIFSAIFKKRTDEEFESHFAVGSPTTTPRLEDVDTRWPQPWVFFRAFLLTLGVFIGLYYTYLRFGNVHLVPAVIIVGSFAVPVSVLVFFFESNAPKNISAYQVAKLVLLGGMLSLLLTTILDLGGSMIGLSLLGNSAAGIVEESAKLLALLFIARQQRFCWTLNGLLFGACVGTGFAIFETAGYAFRYLLIGWSQNEDGLPGILMMSETLFVRALLTPLGGHGILTAIVGAALWRVKRDAPFSLAMLKDGRFLRVFFVAVILHALWNSPLQLPLFGTQLLVGFVAWVVVLSLVQMGLKEIREAQQSLPEVPEAKGAVGQELVRTA